MYPGWIVCGHDDPLAGGEFSEIVNNTRAYAYAANACIGWLLPCGECEETSLVVPNAQSYISPKEDPAPWYDPADPDSEGFLGVVGLEITGAESSTLQASVTMALTGGGVIGPAYHGPRTLTLRALMVAADECSLQFGLNYLRNVCGESADMCVGESLTFFDCCPCTCETGADPDWCWAEDYRDLETFPDCARQSDWPDTYGELKTGNPRPDDFPFWPAVYHELTVGVPGVPCWPDDYGQLRTGPPCVTTSWPDTYEYLRLGVRDEELFPNWVSSYGELRTGAFGAQCWPVDYLEVRKGPSCASENTVWWPQTYYELMMGPPNDDYWCSWPRFYKRLRTGPPQWSCCAEACIVPYLRQFHQIRVTEGPTILNHPSMPSGGAVCEIELVITAADPIEHTLLTSRSGFEFTGATDLAPDPPPPPPRPDPFAIPGVTTLRGLALLTRPTAPLAAGPVTTQWARVARMTPEHIQGNVLSRQAPTITLRSYEAPSGEVRVGVWMGGERLAGWYIPFIPSFTSLTIDVPRRKLYATDGDHGTRALPTFVRDWDGGVAKFPRLPHGNLLITVDQPRGGTVRLLTNVATTAIGATG